MADPKTAALPLGDAPMSLFLYDPLYKTSITKETTNIREYEIPCKKIFAIFLSNIFLLCCRCTRVFLWSHSFVFCYTGFLHYLILHRMKGSPSALHPRGILVIRLSSMGDVLLTTALLRQLRHTYPDTRLDIVTDARFAECYQYNPHCTTRYTLRHDETKPADFDHRYYDIILDLQKNLRSRVLRKGFRGIVQTIDKSRFKKLALVYAHINLYTTIEHITERYRRTASVLAPADDTQGLELWLPEESHLITYPPSTLFLSHQQPPTPHIVIAPGAHHATKRWLTERYAELAVECASAYHARITIVGGHDDMGICTSVTQSATASAQQQKIPLVIDNRAGTQSLFETARIIDTASLVVTNDTGVMHIASARHVPVISIFGSTVREFGFTPFRIPHRIVEISPATMPCRPCTHIGRSQCPKRHFRCMRDVSVEMVMSNIEALLYERQNV